MMLKHRPFMISMSLLLTAWLFVFLQLVSATSKGPSSLRSILTGQRDNGGGSFGTPVTPTFRLNSMKRIGSKDGLLVASVTRRPSYTSGDMSGELSNPLGGSGPLLPTEEVGLGAVFAKGVNEPQDGAVAGSSADARLHSADSLTRLGRSRTPSESFADLGRLQADRQQRKFAESNYLQQVASSSLNYQNPPSEEELDLNDEIFYMDEEGPSGALQTRSGSRGSIRSSGRGSFRSSSSRLHASAYGSFNQLGRDVNAGQSQNPEAQGQGVAPEFERLKTLMRECIAHLRKENPHGSSHENEEAAKALNLIAHMRAPAMVIQRALEDISLEANWKKVSLFKNMLNSFLIYHNALTLATAKTAFMSLDLWHIHMFIPSLSLVVASSSAIRKMLDDVSYLRRSGQLDQLSRVRFVATKIIRESLDAANDGAAEQELNLEEDGDMLMTGIDDDENMEEHQGKSPTAELKSRWETLEGFNLAASSIDDVVEKHVVATYDMSMDLFNGMQGVFTVMKKLSDPVSRFVDSKPIKVGLTSVALALELVRVITKPSLMAREYTVDVTFTVRLVEFLDEIRKLQEDLGLENIE